MKTDLLKENMKILQIMMSFFYCVGCSPIQE